MTAPELKPCPFCGFDDAKIVAIRDGRMVNCHNCHASGPAYYHGTQGIGATPALAAEKWNRRADLSSPLGAVAMRDELAAVISGIEVSNGLTDNGNLWRFWSSKCKELAQKVVAAEAERVRAVEALHFYADFYENPNEGPWGVNSEDFGKVARKALEARHRKESLHLLD